jgi:HD-like signal output (HDOD) protein
MQKAPNPTPDSTAASPTTAVDRALDHAQANGPLREITIPACPELLVALRREMNKDDPDPRVVATIASKDVAMSASLIRTANSPFYARSRSVTSVSDALGVLGIRTTEKILTALIMRNAVKSNSPVLAHFWETSSRRAIAMSYIARQLYGVDEELAYTCGLFCHVGIPILMQSVKGYADTLAKALEQQDRSFTEIENAAHKTDHAVVGALIARGWRLHSSIYQAVRLHHDFSILQDASVLAEVRMLVAMGLIAEHLVELHEGVADEKDWAQHGNACLAHLHVGNSELEAWADALSPQFESV